MNKDIEIIKKIEEVFPKRPMKVNRLIKERTMIRLDVVFVFLFSLFVITIYVPDIYHELTTDYKISQNPIKVDGNIRGKCRSHKYISTNCSVTISYKNHDIERTFSFFGSHNISFSDSDKWRDEVSIIASADDPSLVTIDLAIDKLMSRFLESIVFILIFVFIFFGGIGLIYLNWRTKKIINQINGQKLKPIVVPIHLDKSENSVIAGYKIKDSQGKMIKYRTIFNPKSEGGPIIISQGENGEVNALGIIGETETPPVLLDNQFKRCDFTEQEIQELTNCLSLASEKN